jgi:hypothetical protein
MKSKKTNLSVRVNNWDIFMHVFLQNIDSLCLEKSYLYNKFLSLAFLPSTKQHKADKLHAYYLLYKFITISSIFILLVLEPA